MSNHRESGRSRKSRKPQQCVVPENKDCYPTVTFRGTQSIEIPHNSPQSPVSTHVSLLSNPEEFKFMDEIALLKRGRIDKDAPKHPYSRGRYQPPPTFVPTADCSSRSSRTNGSTRSSATSVTSTSSSTSSRAQTPTVISFMGGSAQNVKTYPVGKDGKMTYSEIKGGGERYELSAANLLAVYQQGEGQTCLFTYQV